MIPKKFFYQDIRIILFSSYETCFITAGDIFENIYARELYHNWNSLFQSKDILVYMREGSLEHLINKKQLSYSHQKENFPDYFNNSWKEYEVLGFYKSLIKYKTSSDLEKIFTKSIADDKISQLSIITDQTVGLSKNKDSSEILTDTILNRNGKGITKDLFNKVLQQRGFTKDYIYNASLLLSMDYIELKLMKHPATIATNLNLHMPFFDHLAPTFPFQDIFVWFRLYKLMGADKYVMNCNVLNIIEIRSSPSFRIFIGNLRMLINYLFLLNHKDYDKLLISLSREGALFFPMVRSEVQNLKEFYSRVNEVNYHFEEL